MSTIISFAVKIAAVYVSRQIKAMSVLLSTIVTKRLPGIPLCP